ncbi:hypothetical protein B9T31_16925 [Acinetobacter sp. ANC 4558]|uniref:hypothetical protein n=1 Tax=Acinetobacter sp. ANC 4558 TaxID=1977876 RepID=UPI000A33138D|nr:hypothetical protein [Acinetobacter sp. ANC 4558]OTG79572.1 hypothetical protein B9T31_16925 [Acinetobacter sp. ANC 4558]
MTYQADINTAKKHFTSLQEDENCCFGCGDEIRGAIVNYDGYTDQDRIKTLSFHPKCANAVGQRLISDGYPHRNEF